MLVRNEGVRQFVLDGTDDGLLRIAPVGGADTGGFTDFRTPSVGGNRKGRLHVAAVAELGADSVRIAGQTVDPHWCQKSDAIVIAECAQDSTPDMPVLGQISERAFPDVFVIIVQI